jgi:Putative zinc finger in N-recognin (UBR box)
MDLYVVLGRKIASARLEAYQSMATLSSSSKTWPRSLRPSQRAFVTASLCLPPDAAADGFVASAILAPCTERSPDPLSQWDTAWLDGSDDTSGLLWNVPLCLYDARIFLTAFARLTLEEQTTHFIALLFVAERQVHACQENVTAVKAARCAGVARVLTVTITAYAMMKLGTPLRRKLSEVLEASLPILRRGAEERANSYEVNCNYMGVFENWENPALPSISFVPMRSAEVQAFPLLDRVLEQAVQLGFAAAKVDNCHILFAAWNGYGKCDLWTSRSACSDRKGGSCGIRSFDSLSSVSTNILRLRDEICMVYRQVKKWHGESLRETALMRVVEEKIPRPKSAQQIVTLLRAMIHKASQLVDALLAQAIPLDDDSSLSDSTTPPEYFCLLEMCAVYVTFAVSMMTRPRTDFFTATLSQLKQQNRSRGDSTDSEAIESSDEGSSLSPEDSVALTLDRIQEVCACLGAAPAHPDWLDRGCRLLEILAPSDAVKMACEAQVCLTKLVTAGLMQSRRQIRRALSKSPCRRNAPNFNAVDVATKLCWLRVYRTTGNSVDTSQYVEGRDFGSDIGDICGFDAAIVNAIVAETGMKQRRAAEHRFLPYSRQCIHGKVPDCTPVEKLRELLGPELRACGEWELLLSSALSSSCVDVRFGSDVNPEVLESISLSERWFFVHFFAIGALVPTVALLRYGMFTTGRAPHPLSFMQSPVDGFHSGSLGVLEEHRHDVESTESVRESIICTLAALAHCPPFRMCHALATHLVIDPDSFATLQGMVASAHSLQALDGLEVAASFDDAASGVLYMIRHATSMLKTFGSDGHHLNGSDSYTIHRLCACILGCDTYQEFHFHTICSRDVDSFSCLPQLHVRGSSFFDADGSWEWKILHYRPVRLMVNYAIRDTLKIDERSRAFFAFVIAQLLTFDLDTDDMLSNTKKELLTVLIEACNSLSPHEIERVICIDICGFPSRPVPGDEQEFSVFPPINESLCTLFAFLLLAPKIGMPFTWAENVFASLERSFGTVKKEGSEYVLNLTLLYASWKEMVHVIGASLFEDLKVTNGARLDSTAEIRCASIFADFVGMIFSSFPQLKPNQKVLPSRNRNDIVSHLPICCSYVLDNDFHEQHWYHCYTCGLTNEKGCCTLCAAICHRGHDVSYSRHSAFFCDCGGEAESKEYEFQRRCKCLAPNARDNFLTAVTRSYKDSSLIVENMSHSSALSAHLCAKILKNTYVDNCLASMEKIRKDDSASSWVPLSVDSSESFFNRWQSLSFAKVFEDTRDSKSIDLLMKNLPEETINLSYGSIPSSGFSFVGEFQSELSKYPCTESGNVAMRHILDADCRGRIVVAESNRLAFFSGFSLLNSQSTTSESATYANISKLLPKNVSFSSTIPLDFEVTGVQFAPNRENVACVWGKKEAKVFFMDPFLSTINFETSLVLSVTRDEDLGSRVVRCQWIPGSNLLLAVGFSDHVSVYDLSKAVNRLAPAVTVTFTATDSDMQDFVVVRMDDVNDKSDKSWTIFAAVANELIQAVVVRQILNGKILVEAKSDCFDSGHSDSNVFTCFNIGDGIQVFPAISPYIVHLEQCNLLLCSSGESDVMVVVLDKNACAYGCFRLLPFIISSQLVGRSDDVNIVGPYRLWKDSGYVFRGEEGFIRLSCIGRLEASGADVLLHVEFNRRCVFVVPEPSVEFRQREYEGLTVFTAPYLVSESHPYTLLDNKEFKESIVVCAVTRSGCFEVFMEDADSFSMPGSSPSCLTDFYGSRFYVEKNKRGMNSLNQSLRIASIEVLENLSDSRSLAFGGGFARYVPFLRYSYLIEICFYPVLRNLNVVIAPKVSERSCGASPKAVSLVHGRMPLP